MRNIKYLIIILMLLSTEVQAQSPFSFNGNISRQTLENYMSRSITMAGTGTANDDIAFFGTSRNSYSTSSGGTPLDTQYIARRNEDVDFLIRIGAKMVIRLAGNWSNGGIGYEIERTKETVQMLHSQDPEIMCGAGIYEFISRERFDWDKSIGIDNNANIPFWVFEAFNLPYQARYFKFEWMVYCDHPLFQANPDKLVGEEGAACSTGTYSEPHHQTMWDNNDPNTAVPDMSRLETQLWFYYLGREYIDAGCETIHLGQTRLMNHQDKKQGQRGLYNVVTLLREYAGDNAYRGVVLFDAHCDNDVYYHENYPTIFTSVCDRKLIFDFNSMVLRIHQGTYDNTSRGGDGILESCSLDCYYGKNLTGKYEMQGWDCAPMPTLLQFDNTGTTSATPGGSVYESPYVFGWDEISWYALQTEDYRNRFLEYAWHQVKCLDGYCFLEFCGRKGVYFGSSATTPDYIDQISWENLYRAQNGYGNQENTIKKLWELSGLPTPLPTTYPNSIEYENVTVNWDLYSVLLIYYGYTTIIANYELKAEDVVVGSFNNNPTIFVAGEGIVLKPGFKANSDFKAKIDTYKRHCDNAPIGD